MNFMENALYKCIIIIIIIIIVSHVTPVRGKPVFVKHLDIPNANERDFYNEHMYKALAQKVPSKEITGIQKIRGLWRLYIENQKTRINLITLGLK